MFIVTDLETNIARALWYSMRYWIECSYRDIKSDGWQWQRTRLSCPERAERIWLAMAVATIFTVSIGGDADRVAEHSDIQEEHQIKEDGSLGKKPSPIPKKIIRNISCFSRGLLTILAEILKGKDICFRPFYPSPWPDSVELPVPNTS